MNKTFLTGTTVELVRFTGRVFRDSGSRYEPGTEVQILGRTGSDYLCRFPGGEETYLCVTQVKVLS